MVKTAGKGIAAAAPGIGDVVQCQLKTNGVDMDNLDLSDLKSEANKLLRQTGDPSLNPDRLENKADRAVDQAGNAAKNAASDPGNADYIAGSMFKNLFKEGQATVSQVDRQDAVNVVMKRTGKSQQESQQIVDNWINTYKQARITRECERALLKVGIRSYPCLLPSMQRLNERGIRLATEFRMWGFEVIEGLFQNAFQAIQCTFPARRSSKSFRARP